VIMAVNVVIGLYYYLQWTALLFRPPAPQEAHRGGALPAQAAAGSGGGPGPGVTVGSGSGAEDSAVWSAVPLPLVAALVLTALLAVAFSGAPQLVLRFSAIGLF
jgi:NADH-quinone oxidoreductase subunit N